MSKPIMMNHHNRTIKTSKKSSSPSSSHNKTYHFQGNDFNSKDGMLTSIWGSSAWHLLHCISFNYPTDPDMETKHHYMNFVKSLRYVLPCGKCRENLKKNFASLPLTMEDMANRDTFSKYIYKLHEKVNSMLDKTSGLSYEEVRERYEHFRARCHQKTTQTKTQTKTQKAGSTATTKKKHPKDLGCVVPFHGKKTKCVLRIVDAKKPCKTFAYRGNLGSLLHRTRSMS